MINLAEFEKYLKIDKHQLDDELVQQPELLYKVGEALTEANAKRDRLKEALATVDAELDFEVREELERSEVKATEAMIKGLIQTHKKHEKAFSVWLTAKLEADKLAVLKESFVTRGYSIKDLCGLYVSSYYEQDSVRSDASTDRVRYERQRERLAEERERRMSK